MMAHLINPLTNLYTVCIQDSDYNEDWIKVETELDLAAMDERELIKVLSDKVVIGDNDRVFVGSVKGMQRVIIEPKGSSDYSNNIN